MLRTLLVLSLVIGCGGDDTVECPAATECQMGTVCSVHGCVNPTQLDACVGQDEGAACVLPDSTNGTCQDGVCLQMQ